MPTAGKYPATLVTRIVNWHATFDAAKAAGGAVELGGVSNTTTVSVVDFTPLTTGVSYEVWVVAVNSRGEGPISNKITFTA